ncbi:MAG: DUF3488 and transglutaminase-like domain-containing protein [Desulfuromonadales bacterium]|nr:DUF3488 and transglutaminase-like domain-containing protein [Desulfuromonadales bacterium]
MISIDRVLKILVYLVTLVGVAPLYLYLERSTQVILAIALIAGLIRDRRGTSLLPPLAATLLSFIFFFLAVVQLSRANLVLPIVNLLVLLLAVRLVSEKQGRQILQIFVLATFALAGSTLLTLSPLFFFFLIVLVLLISGGLVLLSFYGAEPGLILDTRQWLLLLKVNLLLPFGSLLLMLFFFLILPRTQHPLWDFLNTPATASVGFSDQVHPGSVAGLAEDNQLALRVETERLAAGDLYWRGVVLNRLEGQVWKRDNSPPLERITAAGGQPVIQTVYLEAKTDRFLPLLDLPMGVSGISVMSGGDSTYQSRRPLNRQITYQVQSFPGGFSELQRAAGKSYYLQVPENIAPRVEAVAAKIRELPSNQEKTAALEKYFLDQRLSYASVGLQPTENPVETFLFESKQGYCEYFASSFALLLRLAGVPARLVGGYLGGEYNQLGGYYLISENMAHVWVEVLDDSSRWRRVDPSRFAVNAAATLGQRGNSTFSSLRALADATDYYWTRLVISYDLSSQFRLLRQADERVRAVRMVRAGDLVIPLLGVAGGAVFFLLLYRIKQRPHRDQRLLSRYLRILRTRFNVNLDESEGLFTLADKTGHPLCQNFAARYGRAIYRDRALKREDYRYLRNLLRQLKKTGRQSRG